jgi:peptide-methionine (S)-S-oxide reductase
MIFMTFLKVSLVVTSLLEANGFRSPPRHPTKLLITRKAIEEAVFGMGCFWGPQSSFEKMRNEGIVETVVGYTGGNNDSPDYNSVCKGDGHTEAILVRFDNSKITFDKLLDTFISEQDFDDIKARAASTQYKSSIWALPSQIDLANNKLYNTFDTQGRSLAEYVSVSQRGSFFRAEGYHQYWNKKIIPRYILMIPALITDFIPDLPKEVYQGSFILVLGVVLLTLTERVLQSKVQKLDPTCDLN